MVFVFTILPLKASYSRKREKYAAQIACVKKNTLMNKDTSFYVCFSVYRSQDACELTAFYSSATLFGLKHFDILFSGFFCNISN